MQNLVLLGILSGIGILCAFIFIIFILFLIIKRKDALNRIVLNYILIGMVACAFYGLTHNILVNPFIFNSLLKLDFSTPQIQAYFISWAYRAAIYFLFFAVWLRVLLKRAQHWKDKTKIFKFLLIHAAMIATAWITDFEKLLYYGGSANLHHFLHWLGGIIGCTMVVLLEYVFMEKKIITYLNVTGSFQSLRAKLLFLFLGITLIMLLALIGILAGCLGYDPPAVIIIKVVVFSCFFLIPLIFIIVNVTGDFHKNLVTAVRFLEQAEKLDFTSPVNITTSDEFGQLGKALNILKNTISQMISTVKLSAGDVDMSAEKINNSLNSMAVQSAGFFTLLNTGVQKRMRESSRAMENLKEISERIRTIVNHVGNQSSCAESNLELLDNMQTSFTNVNREAREATKISQNLFVIAEEGKTLIQKTLTGMEAIETLSGKINEIISVIEDITEETKILAINAEIESARAGTAGKGFAVVAGHMRTLAGNTARNSQSISAHIRDIFKKVKVVLNDMEKSREGFLNVHTHVKRSRDITLLIARLMEENDRILRQIVESSQKLTEITREVVQFSHHLKKSSEEIKLAFEGMKDASVEETKTTQKNSEFVIQLIDSMMNITHRNIEIAEELQNQVSRFRTD